MNRERRILLIVVVAVLFMLPNWVFALEPSNNPIGIAADTDTKIVGSDIETNTYLKAELIVYQADDADPNYDYYLVEFNMFDQKWQNDYLIDVVNTRIWITAYTYYSSSSKPVALESYREPDPGWRWGASGASVEFYGLTVDLIVPGGQSSFKYTSNYYAVQFGADGNTGIFGWVFVMGGESGATIGFRVPEGKGIRIYASGWCRWYQNWLLVWTHIKDSYTKTTYVAARDLVGN